MLREYNNIKKVLMGSRLSSLTYYLYQKMVFYGKSIEGKSNIEDTVTMALDKVIIGIVKRGIKNQFSDSKTIKTYWIPLIFARI